MKLIDTIKKLNSDIHDVANQKKAKSLRKNLLIAGILLSAFGFGGAFVCFILFAIMGMNFETNFILIPFILFLPCIFIGGIGVFCIWAGLAIIITGVSTQFIDRSVSHHCPNCGKLIQEDDLFCNHCGANLKRKCSKCDTLNEPDSTFCKTCGERLNS